MNLWFRLLHLLLYSLFRPKLEAPFGVSRLQFRVLPNDLDSNLDQPPGTPRRTWAFGGGSCFSARPSRECRFGTRGARSRP